MAVISSVLVIFIAFQTAAAAVPGRGHGDRQPRSDPSLLFSCESVNYQRGVCVLFEQCPSLLKILTDGLHTAKNIRLLQRLTCGFDTEERPMVCCPSADVTWDSGPPLTATAAEGVACAAPLSPEDEFFPDLSHDFRNHTNFGLLPSFQDCGNYLGRLRPNMDHGGHGLRPWWSCDWHGYVGGTGVSVAAYPWMALLGYRNAETGSIEFKCGGSVINSRYVLTAAHCLKDPPEIVRLGEQDTTTDEDCSEFGNYCTRHIDFEVEEAVPHEEAFKSNDIGLIRLAAEIPLDSSDRVVRPVCLPFPAEYGGSRVVERWKEAFDLWKSAGKLWLVGTGWGNTLWDNEEGNTTLQQAWLPLVRHADCQARYTNYTTRLGRKGITISPRQMCAGGQVGRDSCGGDSGGPLQLVSIGNFCLTKVFQLEIVNFGPIQCANGEIPGVYARVSAYRQWILDHIRP